MAEQATKVVDEGVKEDSVAEKKAEEKETVNKVTEKAGEETKSIKPTESVEADFEIISKEATKELNSKQLNEGNVAKQATGAENLTSEAKTTNVESKKQETEVVKGTQNNEADSRSSETKERKKSIVEISVIKEGGESIEDTTKKGSDLQESVSSMPGMTKSVSQEILKKADVTELKQIAQDLAEEKVRGEEEEVKGEEEEEGSVIDISVVEENTDKEDDRQEDIGTVDGIEAEILGDDEVSEVRVLNAAITFSFSNALSEHLTLTPCRR